MTHRSRQIFSKTICRGQASKEGGREGGSAGEREFAGEQKGL